MSLWPSPSSLPGVFPTNLHSPSPSIRHPYRYVSENPGDEVFQKNADRTCAFARDFARKPDGERIQDVAQTQRFINVADTADEEGGTHFKKTLERIIDEVRADNPSRTIGMDITGYFRISDLGLIMV